MKIIKNVKLYRPNHEDDPNAIFSLTIENGKFASINKGVTDEQSGDIIDGKGLTLAPSFNDSHMHLLRFGLMSKELDLREVKSWKEMKEVVKNEYNHEEMEEHEWVIGRGLMDDEFDDIDHPLTAKEIEELDYERPVFFLHDDGHECVVNEEAMKIIKEKDDLTQFPEEFVEKDENGDWTGRFKDTVVHFIKFHFRNKEKDEIKEAVADAIPKLLEQGITSVHTDDLNYVGSFDVLWDAYTELEKEDRLGIDVHLHHYVFGLEDMKKYIESSSKRTGDGTDRVKLGAFKIFLDGTQRLHTSALRKPYDDSPETSGVLNYPPEDLQEMVAYADENNMQVAMHAIGDRSVETALDAIENVGAEKMRHRIIHAQVLAPDLLDRLAKVKPYLETQPGFMMKEYSKTAKWVGEERERYCNPWKSVYQRGIPFTCSSDCPIGPLSPMVEMFAAVNRTDQQGKPEGGWIPEEKLTIDEIYKGYTEVPAMLEFQEDRKGKVEEGYPADFILLSDHPKLVDDFQLQNLKVKETWSQGERVFS
ncbi:amidohydrolase [Planomicrobium sp. Y74]|uniref:amidohydrolase n=1 Tax=Planomicrobium sp. Y74 TaxID=2478977 RepID=UPI002570FBA9|nr:amidohydrolase [Planomicrobium sp. Y74]